MGEEMPSEMPDIGAMMDELDDRDYVEFSRTMNLLEIYSVYGPNWPEKVEMICGMQGEDSQECKSLKMADDMVRIPDNPWGSGECGVKHMKHFGQMGMQGQFQEY